MRNLSRRVESLEDGQGPCPECSHNSRLPVRYEVIWEDEEGAAKESSPPCPRCSNQDVLVIGWPDLPSEPPSFESSVPDYPPFREAELGGGE